MPGAPILVITIDPVLQRKGILPPQLLIEVTCTHQRSSTPGPSPIRYILTRQTHRCSHP
jgi:hypothetical protein